MVRGVEETRDWREKSTEEESCLLWVSLSSGHSLGHGSLEGQLLLLEVLGARVLDLELLHSVGESLLDPGLVAALHFHG